jgi:glycosyltransferase involved in cell wall biosynthesis
LERISEEVDTLSEELRALITVFITDNGSVDNTLNVIHKYQSRNSVAIRLHSNGINIGPDRNIAIAYDSAVSNYVWVFGDDDVILPGRLSIVLHALLSQELDILYVNNFGFKDAYTNKPSQAEKHGFLVFESPLNFLKRTNISLTFISAVIVRSGVGAEFRTLLSESNLIQFSWVLPLLLYGKCFGVIEDFVVGAKSSNSNGYALVNVFGHNLKKITTDILKGQQGLAEVIHNGAIVNFFPHFIMEFRNGTSRFSDSDMSSSLRNTFSDNWRYHIFIYPLTVLPLSFAKIYYQLIRACRHILRPILI